MIVLFSKVVTPAVRQNYSFSVDGISMNRSITEVGKTNVSHVERNNYYVGQNLRHEREISSISL